MSANDRDVSLVRATPVLIRLGVSAWWRAAEWTVLASLHTSARMARAAASGESATQLLEEAEAELRDQLRRLLGVDPDATGSANSTESPTRAGRAEEDHLDAEYERRNGGVSAEELRRRGAELLQRSADVDYPEDGHPAYARILDQLTPDEARILRLLCQSGPQPAVDVRTAGALGRVKSDLVAGGLSMIGIEAGVKHAARVHAYLNNLYRLGLVWFSREPLEDVTRYQVVEAQPEVSEAMDEAGKAKTIRRSIQLTPFGSDFCALCIPDDTGEFEALQKSAGNRRPETGKRRSTSKQAPRSRSGRPAGQSSRGPGSGPAASPGTS